MNFLKLTLNVFISLSSLLPSKIGYLSFSDIHQEDLRFNNYNIQNVLIKK